MSSYDIATQKKRIEKNLQQAGIKLSSFLTDVFGMSGRNLLMVLISKGNLTPRDVEQQTTHLTVAKKEAIKEAIRGRLNDPQRKFLKLQLSLLDDLHAHLGRIEESILQLSSEFSETIDRLDTIPGIAQTAATSLIAETGVDMGSFPTAQHFCSWAGLAPGSYESAGKKKVHESLSATPISND